MIGRKISSIAILVFTLLIVGCEDNSFTPFDHAAQAIIDDLTLIDYMSTHYYDEVTGEIKEITGDEESFYDQAIVEKINYLDVQYNLYHIVTVEGKGEQPGTEDSVLPTYRGELLDGTVFDERISITIGNPWFSLNNVIPGWKYGMVHFKGGINVSQPEAPLEFTDYGEGFLFIPSGLGYRELSNGIIPGSSPLVFKIELQYVDIVETEE